MEQKSRTDPPTIFSSLECKAKKLKVFISGAAAAAASRLLNVQLSSFIIRPQAETPNNSVRCFFSLSKFCISFFLHLFHSHYHTHTHTHACTPARNHSQTCSPLPASNSCLIFVKTDGWLNLKMFFHRASLEIISSRHGQPLLD